MKNQAAFKDLMDTKSAFDLAAKAVECHDCKKYLTDEDWLHYAVTVKFEEVRQRYTEKTSKALGEKTDDGCLHYVPVAPTPRCFSCYIKWVKKNQREFDKHMAKVGIRLKKEKSPWTKFMEQMVRGGEEALRTLKAGRPDQASLAAALKKAGASKDNVRTLMTIARALFAASCDSSLGVVCGKGYYVRTRPSRKK